MSSSPNRPKKARATLILLATALAASSLNSRPDGARAADEKNSCVALYEHSQVLRRDHLFSRAREELRGCSRATCPALVRNDCLTWLDQVQTAMPSLAIHAVKDGSDIANVRVIQDDQVIAARLDGSSLEVDPGEHAFRFETDGAPPVLLKLVVREKEKDRAVPIAFGSVSEPVAAAATSRPLHAGMFVLGGLGVAGLAAFGVLGFTGKSEENSLASTCAPNCSQSSIDRARTEYIAADVGLAVGAAALVSAGIWFFLRPSQSDAAPASHEGVAFAPQKDGAAVLYSGRF